MIISTLLAIALAAAPTTPTTPVVECLTPDVVVGKIIGDVPDADIKEVAKEPPLYIIFTSPSHSTDLKVNFDANNCMTDVEEISKTVASE